MERIPARPQPGPMGWDLLAPVFIVGAAGWGEVAWACARVAAVNMVPAARIVIRVCERAIVFISGGLAAGMRPT
jgi:hypothetical protein